MFSNAFVKTPTDTSLRQIWSDNISTTKTNMEAANGRIVDVDVAAESTRLAKYNVLVQASASMLAQANTNGDIAMMLIR
jgi:flagellin